MFDPATPQGEVEQVTLANLEAFADCLSALPNCDPQDALRFAALQYADDNLPLIEGWNARGVEVRDIDSWVFEVEAVEFGADGTEAIAYVCSYDGTQLVQPATDTSEEELIDALDVSTRSKYLAVRFTGGWLVTTGETIETVQGQPEGYCER